MFNGIVYTVGRKQARSLGFTDELKCKKWCFDTASAGVDVYVILKDHKVHSCGLIESLGVYLTA